MPSAVTMPAPVMTMRGGAFDGLGSGKSTRSILNGHDRFEPHCPFAIRAPKGICALAEAEIHRVEKVFAGGRAPKAFEDRVDGVGLLERAVIAVEELVGREGLRAIHRVAGVVESPIGGQQPAFGLQALE